MKLFRPLIVALTAVSMLLTPSAALFAQSTLPNLGDDTSMTLGAERQMGDQIAREIYRDPEYVSDPVLDAYLDSIWQPLFAQAKRSGSMPLEMEAQFAWRAFLIRDKSVNAFALPGGYFGVHLGLMALAETPDELASVLAHETTHVTQRHISRGMSKERAQTPWLIASMLVGLLAMRTNPQVASAAFATGQATAIQGQLNFSRDFEREADRIGFTLMQPAGYNPQGFVDMFDMLGKASRLSDNGNFPYLRTHPLTTERVADMKARIGDRDQKAGLKSESSAEASRLLLHRLMTARAGVLADLSVDAQKFYIQRAESAAAYSAHDVVALYAAALASWQLKDGMRAKQFYEKLSASTSIKTPPAVLDMVRWLGSELKMPVAVDLASHNRVDVLYAARQLMEKPSASAVELNAAISRLQVWVSERPKDADAWNVLSRLLERQSQQVRSVMASAEAKRALLDDGAALAQYLAAQNLIRQGVTADSVDAAIVDSKVRELQALVHESQKTKR